MSRVLLALVAVILIMGCEPGRGRNIATTKPVEYGKGGGLARVVVDGVTVLDLPKGELNWTNTIVRGSSFLKKRGREPFRMKRIKPRGMNTRTGEAPSLWASGRGSVIESGCDGRIECELASGETVWTRGAC